MKPTISCGSRRVFYGVVITQQLRHSNLPMFDSFSFPGDKIPHPDGGVDGCKILKIGISSRRRTQQMGPKDLGSMGYDGFFDNLPTQACSAECLFTAGLALQFYRNWNASWNAPSTYFASLSSIDSTKLMPCTKSIMSDDLVMRRHVKIHRRCGWSRDHQRALVDKRCHDVTGHPDMSSVEKVVVDLASFFAQKRALLLWQVLVPRRIQDHTRNQVEEGSCALVHFCVTGGTRNQGKFLCQEVFKTSPGVFFWSLVDPTSLNPAQGGLRDAMSGPKLGFLHGSRLHWIWKAYILFFAEATL